MCGIYGVTQNNVECIQGLIKDSWYRGPDASDIYNTDEITLGHNLLAITADAKVGKQPWKTPDGNILVYNGEIFNYAELVKKYKDFAPKTVCDTELLAWGLDRIGLDFIEEIDSMHAFAYYKPKENELYLSRDHVGIKPLFYTITKDGLTFSSESKPLRKFQSANNIDQMALSCWAYCGLNVTDNSFFEGIKKVLPGQTLKYDFKNKKVNEVRRNLIVGGANNKFDKDEFVDTFKSVVKESLLGDQPTGIFLSGGMDSAMIAHEVNKIQRAVTYTSKAHYNHVKGEDYNSDHKAAKQLAADEGYNHTVVAHGPEHYREYYEDSISTYAEPGYNPSIPLYYQVNAHMQFNGVRVTLAGDMGDELLCGYPKYYELRDNIAKGIKQPKTNYEFSLFWLRARLSAPPIYGRKNSTRKIINVKHTHEEVADYLSKTTFSDLIFDKDDLISSYMRFDQVALCPEDFFRRNDHFGMKFSMEGRFPFASKRMMQYCMNIDVNEKLEDNPGKIKGTNFKGKKLSKLAYRGRLPDYIIDKEKTGWTSPVVNWLQNRVDDFSYFGKTSPLPTQNISGKVFVPMQHFNKWYETVYINKK